MSFIWIAADVIGRSPSWGAWIEIFLRFVTILHHGNVAPPRGERGLKFALIILFAMMGGGSLPLVGSVD